MTTTKLPIIVGFGGINAAGRASFHHAYRRLVIETLSAADRGRTYRSLARLMNLDSDPDHEDTRAWIDTHTLVRRIELFDPDDVLCHKAALLRAVDGDGLGFTLSSRHLPDHVPEHWAVKEIGDGQVHVRADDGMDVLFPDRRRSRVSCAGQVPTGFDPGALYQSRNHPRALQLTVLPATSMGAIS